MTELQVSKKGAGAFVLPGLLKIAVQAVPAKKKRVGIDPFKAAANAARFVERETA